MDNPDSQFLVFYLFLIGILIVIIYFRRRKAQNMINFLAPIARKQNARLVPSYFLLFLPRLIFTVDGREAKVSFSPGSGGHPPSTYIKYTLNSRHKYYVRIFPEDEFTKSIIKFALKDIQLNDPAFDKLYIVQSKDEMIIPSFLTQEIRDVLIELKLLKPSICIDQRNVFMSIPSIPKVEKEYDLLFEATQLILQRLNSLG